MNQFPQYTDRPRPPVPLDSYLDDMPTPRPPRWRKYARKALAPIAVVAGTALLVGLMWSAADVLWSMGDKAPVSSSSPVAKPTAVPGPPVPKPVEKSQPVPISTSGDAVYILGKQLGRGEYGAVCVAKAQCTWWVYRVVDGIPVPSRSGTAATGEGAIVVLGTEDYAFGTLGFDAWMPR